MPRSAARTPAVLTLASGAFTAYTYVGYPALVIGLSRLRRPASRPSGGRPASVTVAICAYDEAAVITGRVEDVLAQDVGDAKLEVLVVTDGSTDGTEQVVAAAFGSDERVVALHDPARGGKSAAVNRAVAAARGEVVVITDANNRFLPGTVSALLDAFADPEVAVATGRKVVAGGAEGVAEPEGAYWRYESAIKQAESALGSCVAAAGEITAVRRWTFEPIPAGVALDDFAIMTTALRNGHRVTYVPEATSVEASSADEAGELERRRRIAAGRWQVLFAPRLLPVRRPSVMLQLVSHKFARLLVPFAMALGLVANVVWVARGGGRASRLLLAAQVAAAANAASPVPVPRRGPVGKAIHLSRYLIRSNVSVAGGLARALRGDDVARWQRVQRHGEAA